MNKNQRTGGVCLTLCASPPASSPTMNRVNNCWVSLSASLAWPWETKKTSSLPFHSLFLQYKHANKQKENQLFNFHLSFPDLLCQFHNFIWAAIWPLYYFLLNRLSSIWWYFTLLLGCCCWTNSCCVWIVQNYTKGIYQVWDQTCVFKSNLQWDQYVFKSPSWIFMLFALWVLLAWFVFLGG